MSIMKIVFTLLFATITIVHGDEQVTCNKEDLLEILKDSKEQVQKWKTASQGKALHLFRVVEGVEEAIDKYYEISKSCNEEQKNDLYVSGLVAAAVIAGDTEKVDMMLPAIKDREFLSQVTSLFCAFDCSYLLNFTKKMENVDSKIHIYNVVSDLLEKTDINNTEIITTLPFIRDLNTAVNEEKDEKVNVVLKKLFKNAIKADLELQHDNIEHLYAINKEVTSEVIHELITKYIHVPITDEDDLSLYPLFEMLKCTSNKDIWVDNLEQVFTMLKENDKLKSVYSILLLKAVTHLQKEATEAGIEKLQHITSEIPSAMHIALGAEFCIGVNELTYDNKVFLIHKNGEYHVVKFAPNPSGSKVLLLGETEHYNFSLITDDFDLSEPFVDSFNIEFQKEKGELTELKKNQFCNKENRENSLYACLPVEPLLPTADLDLKYMTIVRKMAHYYMTSGSCDNDDKIDNNV